MADDKYFEETYKFLQEGDDQIEISNYKNVSLILGKSGSGKSVFTQYLVGDNSKLFSEKVGGKFIIRDSNDAASFSSVSKTIFPKLYDDEMTQTAYYDCPGFADNRNVSMDIASTYYIKKAVESAKNIKLILTVSYQALSVEIDRGDHFKSLLEHASTLMPNMEKYKDGISLIATKVPFEIEIDDDGNIQSKSDDAFITSIVDFLETLKPELKLVSPFNNDEKLLNNSMILMDTLLQKEKENYLRIGLFRVPNKAGPLSEIKLLQDGKKPLLKIFNENTKFIPMNKNDFGYTVSDSSKNEIKNWVNKLNDKITHVTTQVGRDLREHFRSKINHSKDINALQNDLNLEFDILDAESKNKIENLGDLIWKIAVIKDILDIKTSSTHITKLVSYQKYLALFQSLSKEKLTTKSLDWIEPLKKSVRYVRNLRLWNNFLVDLYDTLSSWEIQKDKTKYNVANLEDWGSYGKAQGLQVSRYNLRTFLRKVDQIGLHGYNEILENEIEDSELNLLNEILQITLIAKPEVLCHKDKLSIKGDFIKLSEISNSNCKDAQTIEISALNTIFIDENLERPGKKLKLLMIAPRWHIVGNKRINLDGIPNETKLRKASDASEKGGRGSDGDPGLPGGNAGTFLGIGKVFTNAKSLTITANGGRGSDGADAGDGGDGKDGITPITNYHYIGFNYDNIPEKCIVNREFNFKYSSLEGEDKWYYTYYMVSRERNYYLIHGIDCIEGGRGGDGGSKGLGGYGGEVKVVGSTHNPHFSISNTNGSNGRDGRGGSGGNGGKEALNVAVSYKPFNMFDESARCLQHRVVGRKKCDSGSSGYTGENTRFLKKPEKQVKIENPSHFINKYKVFLQHNTKSSLKTHLLKEFFNEFNENHQVLSQYNTLGLIHEMKLMEQELFKHRYEIDLIPIYESLLSRIINYAKNPKSTENTLEHKKVLSFLHSATLSKIVALREDWENNLITDIKGYLDAAIITINELKETNTISAIGQLNKNYISAINQKVTEANGFIENQISREFNQIQTKIQSNIDDLIEETIEIREASKVEVEDLKKKQKQVEKEIQKELTLGILKGIGQGLGLIGPMGAAAGTIITSSVAISETVTMEKDPIVRTVKIPGSVQRILSSVQTGMTFVRDKRLKVLEKQLEVLKSEEDKTAKEDLADTVELVSNMKNNVAESFDNNELDEQKVEKLKSELKSHLKEKQKKLFEKRSDVALKVLNRMNDVTQIVEISATIYDNYRNSKNKLEEVKNAIEMAKNKIEQMKEFESRINSILIPMINTLKVKVTDLQSELPSKSLVALDVSKWQIQNSLKDMKRELKAFTDGFRVEEEMGQCVEKLIETMNILINIYDRIQNYQEQKNLADYIADLNSASSTKIPVRDETLSKAMYDLQIGIKSNVILSEYENVMNGVKQYIFPFVEMHLDDFQLHSDMGWFNSTEDLVYSAVNQIKTLKNKLIKTDTSIVKHDKYVFKADFNPKNHQSRQPFFVWKNEMYRDAIKKLFAGEEISLKADIKKGLNLNAVKFNLIDINFKSKNATLQQEFEKILENYHLQLTHLGNSYYKCNDKAYLITSKQQKISFSFARNNESLPLENNEVYSKIKEGNPMLSPYAMWNIQLMRRNNNFLNLSQFSDALDLELVGYGQYVDNSYDCYQGDLDNYYQLELSTLESLTYEDFQRKRRSVRSIVDNDDEFVQAKNSGVSFSSPINRIFKWIKNSFIEFKKPFNEEEQEYFKESHEPVELQPIDPLNFYQQVDSLLVLSPVFHYLWKNFFNNNKTLNNSTLIRVTDDQVKIWKNFIANAGNLMKTLENETHDCELELNEYKEALNLRKSEVKEIIEKTKVEDQKLEELERNFVAFQVDLVDDINYNKNFSKIKKNLNLRSALQKLFESSKEIPNYSRKYESVKLNYENLDENDAFEPFKENNFNQIYKNIEHISNQPNVFINQGNDLKIY